MVILPDCKIKALRSIYMWKIYININILMNLKY